MVRMLLLASASAALLSCPEPVDRALLRIVEDQIDPVITIVQPKANSFYKTRITVIGALEDSSAREGDHLGSLRSLEVRMPNTATLNRTVTFAEDGTYSVSPADGTFTYQPASGAFGLEISAVDLSGPQLLTFLLTDRNGNATELAISLFDDPTGPHIALESPASYSTYGLIVNIAGKVTNADNDPSTSNVERISWEVPGTPPAGGELYLGPGSPHSDGDGAYSNGTFTFDSADGSFSDQLSTFGRSGTLTFVLRAVDFGGDESETAVQLIDANIAPEVENLVYPQQYSSRATTGITVNGTVTEPADLPYFAYAVADGSPPVAGANITDVDSLTGAFSFTFGVSANTLSGTLTVTISAKDSGDRDSHTSFAIYDDPVAPAIVTGTLAADNSYFDLTFDDAVYSTAAGSGALQPGDLTVDFQANGSTVSLAGHTVSRTDGTALQGGEQTVRVGLRYSGTPTGVETVEIRPADAAVYDDVGNPAPTTTSTGVRLLADLLAASVQLVTSPTPNGSYKAGSDVDVTVRFSETVYVTGTPALTLETGATDRQAIYRSGHGTSTLTFRYTVQPGDASGDLDYAGSGSLAGTIRDNAGNAAGLALPAPGTPESLGGAKAIVVDTTAPAAPAVTILDGDGLINIGENSGVQFTIVGETGATYTVGAANALLGAGASGTLTGGAATGSFTASSDGLVTLSVTLTDAAGNTGSPGGANSTADLTPPSPPSVTLADGDGYIGPTENGTGVGMTITGAAGCSYAIAPTNALVTGGNTGTLSGGTDTRSFSAVANGPVILSVALTDPAGNTGASTAAGSFAYITSPDPPVIAILDGDGLINISENGAGVDFTLSGLAGTTYTITPANATVSVALTGTLTSTPVTGKLSAIDPGALTLSAFLEDPLGSRSAEGSDGSSADLDAPAAPSVDIVDGDGWINLLESSGVDVTISGEAGTTYEIVPVNAALPGGNTGALVGGAVTRTITVPDNGPVTVSVTLTDAAGNQGAAGSAGSRADLDVPAKPIVQIDDKDGTIDSGENSAGVPLKITGEGGTTYNVDPADCTNCTVDEPTSGILPGSGKVTLTLRAVANDLVEVQVTLTDEAGNQSLPGSDTSTASGL